MKTIGMIGGTSWSSTVEYYRTLNQAAAARYGGLHGAKLMLASIDLAELEPLMHAGRWEDGAEILKSAGRSVEAAGADCCMICSNLTHRMFDAVETSLTIPMFHICDAIGVGLKTRGLSKVALIGARETMEEDFYRGRLMRHCRILVPDTAERAVIDAIIFGKLCRDIYADEDRATVAGIVERLKRNGAEAVILGCTELPRLLSVSPLPVVDSVALHCDYAADWAFD
jgi:aspartate racemase